MMSVCAPGEAGANQQVKVLSR